MNPTDFLKLGCEQYLRELPDDEFVDLIQRVRPPDTGQKPSGSDRGAFAKSLFDGGGD